MVNVITVLLSELLLTFYFIKGDSVILMIFNSSSLAGDHERLSVQLGPLSYTLVIFWGKWS